MSHRCPGRTVSGRQCPQQVSDAMLACRPHWYQLPKDIQDEIWAAYRSDGPGSARHTDALADAVSWYRERETRGA